MNSSISDTKSQSWPSRKRSTGLLLDSVLLQEETIEKHLLQGEKTPHDLGRLFCFYMPVPKTKGSAMGLSTGTQRAKYYHLYIFITEQQ